MKYKCKICGKSVRNLWNARAQLFNGHKMEFIDNSEEHFTKVVLPHYFTEEG